MEAKKGRKKGGKKGKSVTTRGENEKRVRTEGGREGLNESRMQAATEAALLADVKSVYRIRVAARGMRISRRKGGERRGRKEEGVATKKATSCARARYVSATL